MPVDQFRRLCGLTQERGIHLFSDEVYRESEYELSDRLPAACDLSSKGVSLGVLSKSYGLAGLRIGWIATHDSVIHRKMGQYRDYTTICSSGPSEFLAALALRHRETLASHVVNIIKSNLKILDAFFTERSDRFTWVRPKAGPIGFVRLLRDHGKPFCHHAVTDAGVLLLPGVVFGYDYENHFRIGFGRRNMPEALTVLSKHLDG
jgi:aspartate/methionine/tyrosine aminotransferase